jgi:glutaredoxin-like YruB-family protein
MIKWIKDHKYLQKMQEKHKDFLVLAFYGEFSFAAKRALGELEQFSEWYKEIPVYIIDVQKVKGVHKQFGVENVPTVLSLEKGKVTRRIEGVESAQLYAQVLSGAQLSHYKKGEKKISHRVIVYTGQGCPACATAKAYLRLKGVGFREVDISRDQHAARRLVQHSGQMAVPQIDIDGHIVVGVDQAKIDRLLSS